MDGQRTVLDFDDLRDPVTGRIRVREVDIHSEYYAVAQEYMIKLEPVALKDDHLKSRLAQAANMTPVAFEDAFAAAGK